MKKQDLTIENIRQAFELLGERVSGYDEIELLIVGGIAGKLAGLLTSDRTTLDCDVMIYDPENAFSQVEDEAVTIGKELGLPKHWLNHLSHGFAHYLPPHWKKRRQHFGDFGLLHVYFLGRFDFIALKLLAGRSVDVKDLLEVRPTPAELVQVNEHVLTLYKQALIDDEKKAIALEILQVLEKT